MERERTHQGQKALRADATIMSKARRHLDKGTVIRCWNYQRTGHIAADCKEAKRGRPEQSARFERPSRGGKPPKAQQMQILEPSPTKQEADLTKAATLIPEDPRQYLLPDSDGEKPFGSVNEVRVQDKGSRPQSVRLVVAGVPAEGIVDTAADMERKCSNVSQPLLS